MSLAALIFLGLFVLVAGLLLREFATVARAHAPAQTRVVFVGDSAPACAADIPKVIWTYWQAEPTPAFIQACIANWRRHAPNHEVRLLHRGSITPWLPELRADFDDLPAPRQADWLRTQLLARHGGIWMDASMMLSRDLAWVHELRARHEAEYVGFYIEKLSTRPNQPIVESWFMASVAGSHYAAVLAAAFDDALNLGDEQVLARLKDEGRHARVVQGLDDEFQRYLLIHVTAADIIDRAPQAHRLVLLRAEDGPYAWLAAVGWRKRHHYARLALTHAPTRLPALIKLRGGDRTVTERNWLKGRWLSGSALIELLGKPDDPR